MKHPLTFKERRGLVAVAAAALLCILIAFLFRNCSSSIHNGSSPSDNPGKIEKVSENPNAVENTDSTDRYGKSRKSKKSQRSDKSKTSSKSKKSKNSKAPKTYPTRDPLSEPCD